MDCIYCKSSNITKDIKVGMQNEQGVVGLKYNPILIATEGFLAELCNDCGSVRLYVKNTDRKWRQKK